MCDICWEDDPIRVQLSCGHQLCVDCLNDHCVVSFKTQPTVNCLSKGCDVEITQHFFDKFANSDAKSAKSDAMFRLWMRQQPNYKNCPTPKCTFGFIASDTGKEVVTCKVCNERYCSKCLEWHDDHNEPMTDCPQVQLASSGNAWWNFSAIQTTKPQQRRALIANALAIKLCPGCDKATWRDLGCLHMKCEQCHHEWCWRCTKDWRPRKTFAANHSCYRVDRVRFRDLFNLIIQELKWVFHLKVFLGFHKVFGN